MVDFPRPSEECIEDRNDDEDEDGDDDEDGDEDEGEDEDDDEDGGEDEGARSASRPGQRVRRKRRVAPVMAMRVKMKRNRRSGAMAHRLVFFKRSSLKPSTA